MKDQNEILLRTEGLSIGYQKKRSEIKPLLSDIELKIDRGQMITLIGPNGAGKSTLIKSLIGFIPILSGDVFLREHNIFNIDSTLRAKSMGVVLTEPVYETNLRVSELVAMGRYQHTNWIGKLEEEDKQAIDTAITNVGLQHKRNSRLGELSDGERQRALIARVLAQDVDLIILDEPTAHLDLPNRMEILLLLRKLSHTQGKGILLSTHELSLALQVSDKIWLIDKQQGLKQEIPERLILAQELDRSFGNDHIAFQPGSASFDIKATSTQRVFVPEATVLSDCIRRMFIRHGYQIVYNINKADIAIAFSNGEELVISYKGIEKQLSNLEQLNDFIVRFES